MSFDDLTKSLEAVLNLFLEWVTAVRNPVRSCNEVLALATDKEKISKTLRLWFVSFLITLVLQFPVLKAIGIEWENLGFHLPNFLILTLLLMLTGAALHWGMKAYGIASNFADTTAAYTTLIGCYSPILAVLAYPATVRVLTALRTAKMQHLSLLQAGVSLLGPGSALQSPDWINVLSILLAQLAQAATFVGLAFLAEKLRQIYLVERARVISAFGFGFTVFLVPATMAILVLQYYNMYTFIDPGTAPK